MIIRLLKSAVRHLIKFKYQSALTIGGLGLAIGCTIFIYIYNSYQLSIDQFHRNANRTFMLVEDLKLDKTEHNKGGSYAMFKSMEQEIPQIEQAAIYLENQNFTLRVGEQLYQTKGDAAFVSSAYFKIFDFPWLAGDPSSLDLPNTVALTKSKAEQLFPKGKAIGEILFVESQFPMEVVGIIDDRILNSDFRSSIYFSESSYATLNQLDIKDGFFTQWGYTNSSNNIFITLKDAQDKVLVEKLIANLISQHWDKEVLNFYSFKLLALQDYHFNTDYGKGKPRNLINILTIIAIGVSIMALVNYVNMLMAQQLSRRGEMQIRKILGGSNSTLFVQLFTESLLVTGIAALLGITLLQAFISWANQYFLVQNPIGILNIKRMLLLAAALWIGMALLSSFILLAFNFRNVGIHKAKNVNSLFWRISKPSLIIIQNVVSMLLLMGTLVIVLQVNYLKTTDIGFSRDMVVVVPLKRDLLKDKALIADYLAKRSDLNAFSFCENPPAHDKVWGGTFQFDNQEAWKTWPARYAIGDSSYIQTFNIKLLAGHNFREQTENPEFVINESMAQQLGFKDPSTIIGKNLHAGGLNDHNLGSIVGVVADFSTHALSEAILPTVIGYNPERIKNVAIKYAGHNPQQFLGHLEKKWQSWFPNELFEYRFLDDHIAQLYQQESILLQLIWIAAIFALVISSLGFLGLLAFTLVKRMKEIAVRKVLGASKYSIFLLLAKDFIRWICIAFVIACPLSIILMNSWLTNFAYHIKLSWWMFIVCFLLCVVTTLLTISTQTIRAASAKLVNNLRDE